MELTGRLPWLGASWAALRALDARGVHAVLLHGAAGIGKMALALDFARSLLCESTGAGGEACGACRACILALSGNHPDLRVVVPGAMAELLGPGAAVEEEAADDAAADSLDSAQSLASEARESGKKASRAIRIEQVRALHDFFGVWTHRGKARVVVLAPAEALNGPAANALLKVLEEPPPATRFVLVSDRLGDVLPTIRSRCVLQRVAVPDVALALAWLREQGVDDPEDRLAAHGGAPLAALRAARQLDDATRRELLALLAQGRDLQPAEIASRVPRTVPLAAAIALLQRWGWDLLAYRAAKRVRYHPRHAPVIADIAATSTTEALLAWLDALNEAQATGEHPLNARLIVEAVLLSYVESLQGAAGPLRCGA